MFWQQDWQRCSRNYWFHNIPQLKSRATCLECWSHDGRGWEIQGYRDRVSSHAARPDSGVDTVTASQLWFRTYDYYLRTVSPFETAVLSITHTWMWRGSAWNVLPKSGYLEGTIRSFNPSAKRLEGTFYFYHSTHCRRSGSRCGFWVGCDPRPLPLVVRNWALGWFGKLLGLAEVIQQSSTAGRLRLCEANSWSLTFIGSGWRPVHEYPSWSTDHRWCSFEVSVPIMLKMRDFIAIF